MNRYVTIAIMLVALSTTSISYAASIDLKLIYASSYDGKAVISTESIDRRVVVVGDKVDEMTQVESIGNNKIAVFREAQDGLERIVISLVNGQQQVQVFKKSLIKKTIQY